MQYHLNLLYSQIDQGERIWSLNIKGVVQCECREDRGIDMDNSNRNKIKGLMSKYYNLYDSSLPPDRVQEFYTIYRMYYG